MEILNLDLFEESFKEIKLKGKIYKVPADIPTVLFFELMEVSKGGDLANMRKGMDILYKIFKINSPDLTFDEFSSVMTMSQYTATINYLFADISIEETMKMLAEAKEAVKDGKKKPPEASV
jgi:hypothetical protein